MVIVNDLDLVPKKPSSFCTSVGDERFGFREGQFEFGSKKRSELLLDGFCFGLWAAEAEQEVG